MPEQKKKNIYPPMILLLIGSFLIFLSWSAYQAAGLGTRVTDAAYYSKGLKYNTTQVEKRAAEVLGWNLETRIDGRILEFYLTNNQGGEIDRATGSLYLAIPGAAENIYLPLEEVSTGLYRVGFDGSLSGTIQARLELERDGARLNRQLLLNF
jgi:nitrogen fixation protein FixH